MITNKRYASLFDIHPVNYKDWAYQLKNCGYATNPKYAENLIRVIETYGLQDITLVALNQKEENPNELIIPQHTGNENVSGEIASGYAASEPETVNSKNIHTPQPVETKYQEPVQQKDYTLTMLHGIKGFYAKKGDMLLHEAIRHKIRYPLLLKINDLKDEPLPYDMFIYLDTKKKIGDRPHIIVKNNDNLHSISQQEGVQLAFLRELNQLEGNEEPETGETVYLQTRTSKKPRLRGPKTLENVDITSNPNQNEPDFIAINQEPDPEEEPEDDGIVKEEESDDEVMRGEEELIAGEDEPAQDDEEVMVVIEEPIEKKATG
ncbi:MAG: hypothetical protein KL787_01580 [Taibaiella sp.]|nr:hypothetical protein [Taibaiella sp.]